MKGIFFSFFYFPVRAQFSLSPLFNSPQAPLCPMPHPFLPAILFLFCKGDLPRVASALPGT